MKYESIGETIMYKFTTKDTYENHISNEKRLLMQDARSFIVEGHQEFEVVKNYIEKYMNSEIITHPINNISTFDNLKLKGTKTEMGTDNSILAMLRHQFSDFFAGENFCRENPHSYYYQYYILSLASESTDYCWETYAENSTGYRMSIDDSIWKPFLETPNNRADVYMKHVIYNDREVEMEIQRIIRQMLDELCMLKPPHTPQSILIVTNKHFMSLLELAIRIKPNSKFDGLTKAKSTFEEEKEVRVILRANSDFAERIVIRNSELLLSADTLKGKKVYFLDFSKIDECLICVDRKS